MPEEKYRVTTEDGIYEITVGEGDGLGAGPATIPPVNAPKSQGLLEGISRFGQEALAPISQLPALGKDILQRGAPAVASDIIGSSVQNIKDFAANPSVRSGVRAVPLIGPMTERATDMALQGDYGGAAGAAASTLLPLGIRKAVPTQVGPIFKNRLNPVEAEAIKSVEGKVPLSVGQRTGTKMLERVEQGLENTPGGFGRTQDFFKEQRAALGSEASRLAAKASPTNLDPYGAGQAVQGRLSTRISRLKGQADTAYEGIRAKTSAAKQSLQTGTDAKGVPIMEEFEAPVDLANVRTKLKPVYDSLNASMPEARRANSPAYKALQDIVTSDKPYMSAMDVDRSLSAVKSLIREGQQNPYLSTPAQRTATQAVRALEAEFQKSLSAADPSLPASLTQARKTVRAYHDTAELLSDLPSEPSQLYSRLVSRDDRILNNLTELSKVAPNEVKAAGRTHLEQMVDKATQEGGFGRATGVMGDWHKMGDRTKQLLYGPDLTKELDNFFLAAKKLSTDANPSGSTKLMASLGGLGTLGAMIKQLAVGDFYGAASAPMLTVVAPNIAARLLMTPSGVRLMTRAITLPTNSPAFKHTVNLLNARYLAEAKRERQQTSPESPAPQLSPVQ